VSFVYFVSDSPKAMVTLYHDKNIVELLQSNSMLLAAEQ